MPPGLQTKSNTKGAALVIPPAAGPDPRVRGAEELPHTPRVSLGVAARRQAQYAYGGPADAEPTFGGAPAIALDRASLGTLELAWRFVSPFFILFGHTVIREVRLCTHHLAQLWKMLGVICSCSQQSWLALSATK